MPAAGSAAGRYVAGRARRPACGHRPRSSAGPRLPASSGGCVIDAGRRFAVISPRAVERVAPTQLACGELARAHHRRLDRVQERGADAGDLELADRGDRRAARRGDHLAQLDRVHLAGRASAAPSRASSGRRAGSRSRARGRAGARPRSSPRRGARSRPGPEPETAVTASISFSGTRTTAPRWASASSASVTCASSACAPAQSPATPSWTTDGVFGIARHDGDAGREVALDRRGRDRRGDREDRLVGR